MIFFSYQSILKQRTVIKITYYVSVVSHCFAICVQSLKYVDLCEILLLFAVVAQAYKVDVEVTGGASRGCTAILRCIIPSYVKDLVRVVSWLHEPSSYIYPSLQGGKCLLEKSKYEYYMRTI